MRRSGTYRPEPGWGAFLIKVAVALYMMGGALWYATGTNVAAGAAHIMTPRVAIDANGNVGIGTSSPSQKPASPTSPRAPATRPLVSQKLGRNGLSARAVRRSAAERSAVSRK